MTPQSWGRWGLGIGAQIWGLGISAAELWIGDWILRVVDWGLALGIGAQSKCRGLGLDPQSWGLVLPELGIGDWCPDLELGIGD